MRVHCRVQSSWFASGSMRRLNCYFDLRGVGIGGSDLCVCVRRFRVRACGEVRPGVPAQTNRDQVFQTRKCAHVYYMTFSTCNMSSKMIQTFPLSKLMRTNSSYALNRCYVLRVDSTRHCCQLIPMGTLLRIHE